MSPDPSLKQRVFTVKEVAQICGNVHPSTIYRAAEAGQILPLKGFGTLPLQCATENL
jgi:hypothetical protein